MSDPHDLLQISPIRPYPHLNQQRHRQRMNFFHLFSNQRLHRVYFFLRDFKNQFIVNLQRHPRLQAALLQRRVDANHCHLDQIRCGALQRRVYGSALGEATLRKILAVDIRNGANASVQSSYFQIAPGFFQGFIDECADAFVSFEIIGDE